MTTGGKDRGEGKSIPPSHIFREYDIRGIAGADLAPAAVEVIGRAYAQLLREAHPALPVGRRPRVAVAGDVRLSSPEVASALMEGISSQEIDIFHLGVCPTPLLISPSSNWMWKGGSWSPAATIPPNITGSRSVWAEIPFMVPPFKG